MPEDTQNKIKALAYPALISIVGFGMMQIFFDIKEVKSTVTNFNTAINQNTNDLRTLQKRIEVLEKKEVIQQTWVRDWIERWQSAVDWADNERKK